jgi:hypothetical protein
MSEASRAAALAHAALVHQGSGDGPATLETAEAFHAFISPAADTAPAKTPAKTATKPATTPAKTPAKKPPPPPADDDAEDETGEEPSEDGEVTKEAVGDAIEALLNANLRDKAMGLFKKYKAKSLSGVKPEDYAAIKQDADDILMANA